jgi:hypothetical protein
MVQASLTLNLGVISLTFSQAELSALQMRFKRDPLYHGPCLLIDRRWGLALDSTTNPGTDPACPLDTARCSLAAMENSAGRA